LAVRAVQSMSWVVVAAVSALNSAWQGARWQEAGFKQMWLQGVLSWPAGPDSDQRKDARVLMDTQWCCQAVAHSQHRFWAW